jgi:PKD repeat protein
MAAGDIACAKQNAGGPGKCSQMYTSDLALAQKNSFEGLDAVLALGDEQYEDATLTNLQQWFDPSWGRLNSILKPAPGNHEYDRVPNATGYFDYFASKAVQTGGRDGWYSFDLGSWHLVSLNSSNACSVVSCASGSPQESWLRNDLAATGQPCILAYWHHPFGNAPKERDMWQDLYTYGVDFVLTGHNHKYIAPIARNPNGTPDANGPREVVIGTGGDDAYGSGLLKMNLHANSADWRFVGSGASDSGSANCHGSTPPPIPPPVITPPTTPKPKFEATPQDLTVSFEDISNTYSPDPTVTPTWFWDFGDGTTSIEHAPVHPYAKAGTYEVTFRITASGLTGETTGRVTVEAPATPPVTPSAPAISGPPGGGGNTQTTATTVTTTPAPAPEPNPDTKNTANNARLLGLRLSYASRLTLTGLRKGFRVTLKAPTGKTLQVMLTLPASVAERAHLHHRRLAKITLTRPGVANLHLGPKTRAALRGAKGKLTAVLAVTGPGVTPYAKTLTLHR